MVEALIGVGGTVLGTVIGVVLNEAMARRRTALKVRDFKIRREQLVEDRLIELDRRLTRVEDGGAGISAAIKAVHPELRQPTDARQGWPWRR